MNEVNYICFILFENMFLIILIILLFVKFLLITVRTHWELPASLPSKKNRVLRLILSQFYTTIIAIWLSVIFLNLLILNYNFERVTDDGADVFSYLLNPFSLTHYFPYFSTCIVLVVVVFVVSDLIFLYTKKKTILVLFLIQTLAAIAILLLFFDFFGLYIALFLMLSQMIRSIRVKKIFIEMESVAPVLS